MCKGVISENWREKMQGNIRYKGKCIHYYVELSNDRGKIELPWESAGCLLMRIADSHKDMSRKERICVHMYKYFLVCLVTLEVGRRLTDGSGP